MDKKIIIIAGPNGAGKTTFARSFLPKEAQVLRFINADLIAAGLSPFSPDTMAITAGRLMLQELIGCVHRGESFAFETTLSGLAWLQHIKKWQSLGYRIVLYFLSLQNVELALLRVAERVKQGGHNIPEAVIRRRFEGGLSKFEQYYKSAVNEWTHYDNSSNELILLNAGENK